MCVLEKLCEACPNLIGISLAGWKSISSDHLQYLTEEFKSLRRIDLSSISVRRRVILECERNKWINCIFCFILHILYIDGNASQ